MFWKNLGLNEKLVKELPIINYELALEMMNLEAQHNDKESRKNGKH